MSYTLTQNWLPATKYDLKAPYQMQPQGLVVHNTAGTASAAEEVAAMIASASAVSFHVCIDESTAVEAIPFSRNAWHAGDGSAGYANRHLIGLEIARSADQSSDRFARAEANAVLYIAHVCIQYGWSSQQLHQHNWYSATSCPHRTREHWQAFLDEVDQTIARLAGESEPERTQSPTLTLHIDGQPHTLRGHNTDATLYVSLRDLAAIFDWPIEWKEGAAHLTTTPDLRSAEGQGWCHKKRPHADGAV